MTRSSRATYRACAARKIECVVSYLRPCSRRYARRSIKLLRLATVRRFSGMWFVRRRVGIAMPARPSASMSDMRLALRFGDRGRVLGRHQLRPNPPPVIGAKVAAGDSAIGGNLNGGAVLGWNVARSIQPVPDVLLFHANRCCKSSLAAKVADGIKEGSHARILQQLF